MPRKGIVVGTKSKVRNSRKLFTSKMLFVDRLHDIDMRYAEYLKTDWWKSVREKHLVGKACAGCDHPATELHHITYVNIGKETSLDVLPLCARCHAEVHARLDAASKSVEWTAWALRNMFGWTRKQTNLRFNLSYSTSKVMSVMAGKI